MFTELYYKYPMPISRCVRISSPKFGVLFSIFVIKKKPSKIVYAAKKT